MSGRMLRSRKAAKIFVWWDVATCPVPRRRFHVKAIATNIKSGLLKLGYHGPVSISAYGDNSHFPRSDQRALSSSGISFNHVRPDSYDLLLSLMGWAIDNPSPANILVISGNASIPDALCFLSERGYNIMLALPREAYPPRFKESTAVWFWSSLLAGGSPVGSGGVDNAEAVCLAGKTSVWWRIENKLPTPGDLEAITENINNALKNLGYSGPVSFFAFGDIPDIPDDLFSSTTEFGIILYHFPPADSSYSGECEAEMLFHLMNWALQNPPPANLLLISGDGVFSAALHHLVESGYNILLAQPKAASCATLAEAAKTVWISDHLFAGGSPVFSPVLNVSKVPIQMKKKKKRYRKAEYLAAKTSVWWDMELCPPPRNWDQSFAENINRALLRLGFGGPVSIFGYRYTNSYTNDDPISYRASLTGISLNPIASGEVMSSKYLTGTKMIVEMFAWALENPPPANILLISRGLDFWATLEALKMRGFNILVGTTISEVSAPLVAVASTAWPYLDLLAGDPPLPQPWNIPVFFSSDKECAPMDAVAETESHFLAKGPPKDQPTSDKERALAKLENDSTAASALTIRLVII